MNSLEMLRRVEEIARALLIGDNGVAYEVRQARGGVLVYLTGYGRSATHLIRERDLGDAWGPDAETTVKRQMADAVAELRSGSQ